MRKYFYSHYTYVPSPWAMRLYIVLGVMFFGVCWAATLSAPATIIYYFIETPSDPAVSLGVSISFGFLAMLASIMVLVGSGMVVGIVVELWKDELKKEKQR